MSKYVQEAYERLSTEIQIFPFFFALNIIIKQYNGNGVWYLN